MLGYDLPSLTRLTVFNLHPAEEYAQVRDRLQSLAVGGVVNTEVRWFRSDGSEVWGLLRAVPLENGRRSASARTLQSTNARNSIFCVRADSWKRSLTWLPSA
jgi:PAS domain S-box-containing protein